MFDRVLNTSLKFAIKLSNFALPLNLDRPPAGKYTIVNFELVNAGWASSKSIIKSVEKQR